MKKHSYAFMLLLIFALLVFHCALATDNDTRISVIDAYTISQTTLLAPGTLTVSASIHDNVGISYAFCSIFIDGHHLAQQQLRYNTDADAYETTFDIESSAWQGTGDLLFTVYDKAMNFGNRIYTDALTIINPNEDRDPPVLADYTISSTEVAVPDSIEISVLIKDQSDISFVDANFRLDEDTLPPEHERHDRYVSLEHNIHTNQWEGIVELDNSTCSGVYDIELIISDSADNFSFPKIDQAYSVINPDADMEFPIIGPYSQSDTGVTAPASVDIAVEATDNNRVASVKYALYREGVDNRYFYDLSYNAETGLWDGTIPIGDTMPGDEYTLEFMAVDQDFMNCTYKAIPQALTVINPAGNTELPVIETCTASPSIVTVPGTVTITAGISSVSDLGTANVQLIHNGDMVYSSPLFATDGNERLARFYLSNDYRNGSYDVEIYAIDQDGNFTKQQFIDLFTVLNSFEVSPYQWR